MPSSGPRMVGPKLTRTDYFESHSYTLTIAQAVDIRLTDRQARDLYQQLHEEFKPRAMLGNSVRYANRLEPGEHEGP